MAGNYDWNTEWRQVLQFSHCSPYLIDCKTKQGIWKIPSTPNLSLCCNVELVEPYFIAACCADLSDRWYIYVPILFCYSSDRSLKWSLSTPELHILSSWCLWPVSFTDCWLCLSVIISNLLLCAHDYKGSVHRQGVTLRGWASSKKYRAERHIWWAHSWVITRTR